MLYNNICPIDQQDKIAKQTYSGYAPPQLHLIQYLFQSPNLKLIENCFP